MPRYEFECPHCGGERFEEVMVGVIQYSTFSQVETGVGWCAPEYDGNTNTHDGSLDHYQCMDCGESIRGEHGNPIHDTDGLGEWMQKHGKLIEEPNDTAKPLPASQP